MATKHLFRFGTGGFPAPDRKTLVALARKVEYLGYATILLPDHFESELLSPFLAMLTIAEATQTLRVGSYVIDNDFRHPALLAKEAATLDVLSEGRLELGIGAGWKAEDYTTTGIVFDTPGVRVARLIEAVQIIKRLFIEEKVSFAGTYYSLKELEGRPHPHQRPHPPIFIGGGSKRLLTLAGHEANIVGLVPRASHGTLDFMDASHEATIRKVEWVRQAAGERFDDLEFNTLVFECVITDHRRQAAEQLAQRWQLPDEHILNSIHFLIGSVRQIIEELQIWRERFGISYVTVFPQHMEMFAPVVGELSGK